MRILVTACGAPGAPGIIKSLKIVTGRDIELIGVDMNPQAVGFGMVSRGYTVPAGGAPDFVDSLLDIVRRERVDVVLPLSTSELVPLSLNRGRFEEIGARVCVSSPEAIRIANNKVNLYRFLRENGVVVPDFRVASSFEEFAGAVRDLGYPETPVCFKPEVSNGGRGFRVLDAGADKLHLLLNTKPSNTIATWEDIAPILRDADPFPKLLVSEYLPGMEYSADVLLKNGEPLVTIPRSRDVIKLGIAFIGRVEKNAAIIGQAERIARLIGLDYTINIQFKYSRDGIPKIIEINPRVSGTIVLCTGAGVNLPWLAVQLALGENPVIPEPKWGTTMVRYWSEIFSDENGLAYTL